MGKLIICNGKLATKPYYHKITGIKLYSIEELCYYVYNHMDVISQDFFSLSLVDWIKEELMLEDLSLKLVDLIKSSASLKDISVCILCSCDYYTELEIRTFIIQIDNFYKLTPYERRKMKADNYLTYRRYREAQIEYESMLFGEEIYSISNKEYGDILHNLALVTLHTKGILAAVEGFKEAYNRNQNVVSLKHYLYTLKLSKQENAFSKALELYKVNDDVIEDIEKELNIEYSPLEESSEYRTLNQLTRYKEQGKGTEFYQLANELIERFKVKYRMENG